MYIINFEDLYTLTEQPLSKRVYKFDTIRLSMHSEHIFLYTQEYNVIKSSSAALLFSKMHMALSHPL